MTTSQPQSELVKDEGIVLTPSDFAFEKKAVLNPSCIENHNCIHMFYRAVNPQDVSSIGYCQIKNNKVIKKLNQPLLSPEYNYEKQGLEDPRITKIGKTFYLFYTAYDGQNALIAYATSSDLKQFKKKGLISPKITYDEAEDIFRSHVDKRYRYFEKITMEREGHDVLLWEKDACLFPKKFNGSFALIHRILPGIQVVYFKKFSDLTYDFWRQYLKRLDHHIILNPERGFENRNIGAGCPPIETPLGWLLIFHSVEDTGLKKIYHASAALLDLKNPQKILGRLKEPLFSPTAIWEIEGVVNDVVFPTGAVVKNGRIYIYYGAADRVIAAKSIDLKQLLDKIMANRPMRKTFFHPK